MNLQNPSNSPADFVNVRLSAAGQEAAKGGPLSVHGGGVALKFTGDEAQPIHLTVWRETLSTISPFGTPYFELAPAVTEPKPAVPVDAPTPKPSAE